MKHYKVKFIEDLKSNKRKDIYQERIIGYLISPVITGIKPSSMINIKKSDRDRYEFWNKSGYRMLKKYDLKYLKLKETDDMLLLLIYDEENLKEHLNLKNNKQFLCSYGYGKEIKLENCLGCLKNRLNKEEFPHECGIFLGIPLEDVQGFLSEDECVHRGIWKVYSDKSRSEEIFNLYDKSKEEYVLGFKSDYELKDMFRPYKEELYSSQYL